MKFFKQQLGTVWLATLVVGLLHQEALGQPVSEGLGALEEYLSEDCAVKGASELSALEKLLRSKNDPQVQSRLIQTVQNGPDSAELTRIQKFHEAQWDKHPVLLKQAPNPAVSQPQGDLDIAPKIREFEQRPEARVHAPFLNQLKVTPKEQFAHVGIAERIRTHKANPNFTLNESLVKELEEIPKKRYVDYRRERTIRRYKERAAIALVAIDSPEAKAALRQARANDPRLGKVIDKAGQRAGPP
jgi:hypothetical protein